MKLLDLPLDVLKEIVKEVSDGSICLFWPALSQPNIPLSIDHAHE